MSDFLTRVKVVLGNVSTWLIGASAVVAIFAEEIVAFLPDEWDGSVTQAAVVIVAVLTAAVNIIRRVTPVIDSQRGLLPVPGVIIPEQNAPVQ